MQKAVYVCSCLAVVLAASWLWRTQAEIPTNTESATQEGEIIEVLSSDSDLIVTGHCVSTRSMWVEDNRILVTLATIEVSDTLKGESDSTIEVVLPGGTDMNRAFPVAMTYPGAPSIVPDEEVFLFLNDAELVEGGFSVSRFNEGKFSILNDEDGGKQISRDYIKGSVKSGPGVVRGNRQFVPLGEFKNKVREIVGN